MILFPNDGGYLPRNENNRYCAFVVNHIAHERCLSWTPLYVNLCRDLFHGAVGGGVEHLLGRTPDDATSNGKFGGLHEVQVDLAGGLSSFVDTPMMKY